MKILMNAIRYRSVGHIEKMVLSCHKNTAEESLLLCTASNCDRHPGTQELNHLLKKANAFRLTSEYVQQIICCKMQLEAIREHRHCFWHPETGWAIA